MAGLLVGGVLGRFKMAATIIKDTKRWKYISLDGNKEVTLKSSMQKYPNVKLFMQKANTNVICFIMHTVHSNLYPTIINRHAFKSVSQSRDRKAQDHLKLAKEFQMQQVNKALYVTTTCIVRCSQTYGSCRC